MRDPVLQFMYRTNLVTFFTNFQFYWSGDKTSLPLEPINWTICWTLSFLKVTMIVLMGLLFKYGSSKTFRVTSGGSSNIVVGPKRRVTGRSGYPSKPLPWRNPVSREPRGWYHRRDRTVPSTVSQSNTPQRGSLGWREPTSGRERGDRRSHDSSREDTRTNVGRWGTEIKTSRNEDDRVDDEGDDLPKGESRTFIKDDGVRVRCVSRTSVDGEW